MCVRTAVRCSGVRDGVGTTRSCAAEHLVEKAEPCWTSLKRRRADPPTSRLRRDKGVRFSVGRPVEPQEAWCGPDTLRRGIKGRRRFVALDA